MVHLASWGHVVASPDHRDRNLEAVLDNAISAMSADVEELARLPAGLAADAALAAIIDTERLAAVGHSAGGAAALRYAEREAKVDVVIGLAPAVTFNSEPREIGRPVLVIAGGRDRVTTATNIRAWVERGQEQELRRYYEIRDAGHLTFSDICTIGRERGGILAIAEDSGIFVNPLIKGLARDGCRDDDLAPELAWPVIHHASVRALREAFGREVPAQARTASCFGDLL